MTLDAQIITVQDGTTVRLTGKQAKALRKVYRQADRCDVIDPSMAKALHRKGLLEMRGPYTPGRSALGGKVGTLERVRLNPWGITAAEAIG